jgi:hypothetical protein
LLRAGPGCRLPRPPPCLPAGQADFLLSDLLTAQGQSLRVQLRDEQGRPLPGCVALLSGEELPQTNAVVSMSLSASRLDNLETFSRSDPFLRISKMRENGEWVPVLKTEVVPNNLNPAWRPFRAALSQLCNCDPHRPLLLEVGRLGGRAAPAPLTRQGRHGSRPWPRRLHSGPSVQPAACPPSPQVFDAEASGAHRLIGAWQGSLQALRDAAEAGQPLPLVNEKKRAAKAGYVSSGSLLARSVTVQERPSFLDYVRGGCSLNFLVAIDFTASNGNPADPSSLHFTGSGQSVYERAIQAVGSVLEHYDTDRRFPCYGFGAALPPSGTASHCFPLNGVPASPEVEGVAGVLEAYRATVRSVRLSGPTLFAPIITEAARVASQPSSHLEYYVLLIITDGCIMDMNNTLQAVVDASQLPLSLLIVGVGDEDFSAMERLDGDDGLIRAPNGRLAARDLVQFVPLNQVFKGPAGRRGQVSRCAADARPCSSAGACHAAAPPPYPAALRPHPAAPPARGNGRAGLPAAGGAAGPGGGAVPRHQAAAAARPCLRAAAAPRCGSRQLLVRQARVWPSPGILCVFLSTDLLISRTAHANVCLWLVACCSCSSTHAHQCIDTTYARREGHAARGGVRQAAGRCCREGMQGRFALCQAGAASAAAAA